MSYATVPHIVRPRMVARHLRTASMADAAACMTSSYLRVPGTFDWSEDGRQLTFVGRDITLSRVARIETGQSVSWPSQKLMAWSACVSFRLPMTEPSRRNTSRIDVCPQKGPNLKHFSVVLGRGANEYFPL